MAKKTLRERLAEESALSEAQMSTRRQGMFVKYWEQICDAYLEGWSYKEIWRVLYRDGLIDFSYSCFVNYAQKLRRRQVEFEMERKRKAGNAAAIASAKADLKAVARTGSTRVDMPKFGQEAPARDPKRF